MRRRNIRTFGFREPVNPKSFRTHASNASLEGRLQQSPTQATLPLALALNDAESYGITIETLAPFLQKTTPDRKPKTDMKSFLTLWALVDVLHNTESFDGRYGLSHDILTMLNSPEILAVYLSLHPIKYGDKDTPQFREKIGCANNNFPLFISKGVGKAYHDCPALREMANERFGYNGHPTKPGALIERMKQVTKDDIERVIRSLFLENRGPGKTTKELTYPYPDPASDIKKDTNYELRLAYTRPVVNFYKKLYLFNTRTGATAGR